MRSFQTLFVGEKTSSKPLPALVECGSVSSTREAIDEVTSFAPLTKMPESRPMKTNYRDHCRIQTTCDDLGRDQEETLSRRGGGASYLFPVKLHEMLSCAEIDRFEHIVSWQSHGRCFKVHKPSIFVKKIMPKWFKQTQLRSFQRQLNLYGFSRLTTGIDRGGYYHEKFLRGHFDLCSSMLRTRIKGIGVKDKPATSTEPNFYQMPPCTKRCNAINENEVNVKSHQQVFVDSHTGASMVSLNSEDSLGETSTSAAKLQPTSIEVFGTPKMLCDPSPSLFAGDFGLVNKASAPNCLSSLPNDLASNKPSSEDALDGDDLYYFDPDLFDW